MTQNKNSKKFRYQKDNNPKKWSFVGFALHG